MKKTLVLLTLISFAFCLSATAKKVEIKDAQRAGINFYYEKINTKQATPYLSIKVTDNFTEMKGNEPVFYTFNINAGKGFIFVAADDAVQPILGYAFEGSYSAENHSASFDWWMKNYADEIEFVRNQNFQPDAALTSTWNHLLTAREDDLQIDRTVADIAPLLTCNWNQDFPYNALCPADAGSSGSYQGHVPVGCVATALAQIMYYWGYPNQGVGNHCIYPAPPEYGPQCANFGTTTYEWNGMADAPAKECNPVSVISYHCGVAVNMDYGPDGSGAQVSAIPTAIKNYFKYANTAIYLKKSNYSNTDWENLLKDDLDAGKPIEYAGFPSSGAGHAWVCDGYQSSSFFHFNWGWAGSDNGYFYLSNLNPSGYNFSTNQQAVMQIEPDPAFYPANCTGTKTISTYNFGTFEDGSGPVDNYLDNTNCSWLINIDDSIQTVTLKFTRFATEAINDVVTVYDGNSTSAPVLGTFSGTAIPSSVTSTGPQMFVTFVSNGSTSAQGFLASYETTVNAFCTSNATLTATTGDFTDGSDRFQYRNLQTCKWVIQPPNATSVTLSINSIDTELNKDVVEVYDYVTSQKLGTFSGTTIPLPVSTTSGKMLVMFKTNGTNRGAGFDASYSTVVGVNENEAVGQLSVYPNPTEGMLNVSFTLSDLQKVNLDVISPSGASVYSENLGTIRGTYSKQLNLSSLSKGIYFLRITSNQGVTNKKIVVN